MMTSLLNNYCQPASINYYSYDMNVRPTMFYDDPPLQNPVEELPSTMFHQLSGFWPGQFDEIVRNLVLIPDQIVCPTTRCRLSKHLQFFAAEAWKKADTWEDVAHDIRHCRMWCIKVYQAIFELLVIYCRKVVQVLNYRRIVPLLESWSDDMVHFNGCSQDVLFFTDGKPWKLSRPGHGDAAAALVRATGGDDINLVQQAYYNGHYGFAGDKVQHVLQADGMC